MILASTAGPEFVHYAVKHIHFLLHHTSGCTFNAEMTLDLEVNEVEVKGSARLASVIWSTARSEGGYVSRHST